MGLSRQASDDLPRLRELAARTPRNQPGRIELAEYVVSYTDALSLYVQYKDIFCNRIHHFSANTDRPRIIDGGACIGMAALYFKSVYPRAEIVCLEPDEALFAVLKRNVEENGLTNVKLVRAGLAEDAGPVGFLPDQADGGRIVGDQDAATVIETVRLSDYLSLPADFLKLNIEGQELPVLLEVEAAGRLGNVREMAAEYHGWAEGRQTLGPLLDLLDRNGFHYMVHDFDAETHPASKPPFGPARPKTWFCLMHACRLGAQAPASRHQDPGEIDWGNLRRPNPVSRVFGLDRGLPIDRHYIEQFLSEHSPHIRGHVLDIGDDTYTRRFGGDRVSRSDVLHAAEGERRATIVADLASADRLPGDTFDCIICTQTLQCIYDMPAAVLTLYRILKPAGVLLATFSGISQISRYDMNRWGDYWRLTSLSARRLLEEAFPSEGVTVKAHGNVLAASAFLYGLAAEEMTPAELHQHDPDYELLITAKAVKPDVRP